MHCRPSNNAGHFPQILNIFKGLKIRIPSGSIFKMLTDDVNLWS